MVGIRVMYKRRPKSLCRLQQFLSFTWLQLTATVIKDLKQSEGSSNCGFIFVSQSSLYQIRNFIDTTIKYEISCHSVGLTDEVTINEGASYHSESTWYHDGTLAPVTETYWYG